MVIIGFDHPHISVLDFTGLLKWNSFDLKHWDRGCFHKWENPKMHGLFHGKSIHKWMISGYPHFGKLPSYVFSFMPVKLLWQPCEMQAAIGIALP